MVYNCRQYGVKNIFLSGLAITNRLPEQLIKEFNISIRNICSQTPDCDYIDNANITLHLFFFINNPFLTLAPKTVQAFLKNCPKRLFSNCLVDGL